MARRLHEDDPYSLIVRITPDRVSAEIQYKSLDADDPTLHDYGTLPVGAIPLTDDQVKDIRAWALARLAEAGKVSA